MLADVLTWLELTPDELAGRLPLLQSALATAHGSVTAVLLPMAVSMVAAPADLAQIATVIAGRAEKRQKAGLLSLLRDPDLQERLGVEAVLGALAPLEESDDTTLRERAAGVRRALTGGTGSSPASDPNPSRGCGRPW